MVLESFTQSVVNVTTDPLTYAILSVLVAIPIYLFLKGFEIQKMYAFVLAILIPIIALEFIFKAAFGYFNVPIAYGSYNITIPYTATEPITEGVMVMKALDFVFNFGIFREFGLPYFEAFTKTLPALPEPSFFFKTFVFTYVSSDSIIEYVFFFFAFTAAIIITSDVFKQNSIVAIALPAIVAGGTGYLLYGLLSIDIIKTIIISAGIFGVGYIILSTSAENSKISAIILALIPVLAYMFLVSNPIEEYKTALPSLQKISYFFQYGNSTDKWIFILTLVASFFIVMEFLAAAINFFYSVGANTLKPSWESKVWTVSTQGLGFAYAASFAVMYALHQFAWYIFFPALVLYSLFKKAAGSAISIAQEHKKKQGMAEYFQSTNESNKREQKSGEESDNTTTKVLVGVVVAVVVLSALLARDLGLV